MIRSALEVRISQLETEISKETASINAAIAGRQIGDGYWKHRHTLEAKLRAALAVRDAINEVMA